MPFWEPQLGPQLKAATCPVDFVFFGGSRGGGKSDCLLGRQLYGAQKHKKHWNGLILRRKYKEFAEMRRRIDGMIEAGLPAVRVGGDQQTNFIRFGGSLSGAQITMAAVEHEKQLQDFVGQQYTEISIDECTTFPFFYNMVDKLKGSNRSPYGVPCRMFGTGNPGGPGHNAVKEYFGLGSDGVPPETVMWRDLDNGMKESRIFIPSFLDDNKILCENDPLYVARLKSISDPALRRAWLDGDWDVFIGQAFTFSREHHVIEPYRIPPGSPIYTTFDWGFGKPFSWGWWFIDNDGRAIRFSEWYGSTGVPDEGLRLADADIAEGIVEREKRMSVDQGCIVQRLAGPDCFSKKPDYKGGGQGRSTAEVFADFGIYLMAGDPSRELKIRQFRERLRIPRDDDGHVIDAPMLQVFSTCKDFIRTIPALCMDENKPEDIDTSQEDHCFAGDTLVDTDQGQVPIRDLVGKSGYVLTAGGYWTRFSRCRLVSKNVKTVRITFEDGRSIVCTPDHRFYVKTNKYTEAKDLTDEACHVSIPINQKIREGLSWKSLLSTKQSKILTASHIGSVVAIFREKAKGFIGWCGSSITELSQGVVTSITKTMMLATTSPATLSYANLPNTYHPMQHKTTILHGLRQCARVLLRGMEARRVLNGTSSNMKKTASIGLGSQRLIFARNAEKNLKEWFLRGSALANASSATGKSLSAMMANALSVEKGLSDSEKLVQGLVRQERHGKTVRVLEVEQSKNSDVYCLDAAFTHAFCVEGGILVHNCYDEACHIVMARPINEFKLSRMPVSMAGRVAQYVTGKTRIHPDMPVSGSRNTYLPAEV